ncbi:hypothetical protein OAN08_01250 [Candidatus Pelagibacter sp.]|jgi:hypothetical protein|nr:hypothetical protein [Candidatus Pelagibacter sp.]
MKKINENFYVPIYIICLFLSFVIVGEKYGFYHSLPSYYLFEMPNDIYGGNALINFFKWNLGFVLYFLTLFIISVIFKVKIELFKFITKMIKKKSVYIFYFLVPIFGCPLFSLLIDYSNLMIGMEFSNGKIIPVTFPGLVALYVIGYFAYKLMYKK